MTKQQAGYIGFSMFLAPVVLFVGYWIYMLIITAPVLALIIAGVLAYLSLTLYFMNRSI